MDKHLHIITLDVPWPADYGGAIEQFHKITSLHQLGIKIHLHCFHKNRQAAPQLEQYCESVHYYARKLYLAGFSFTSPYIVSSRNVAALITDLRNDNYPILMEGVHCTHFLQADQLAGRKVLVRLHNTEYKYYSQLAKYENKIFNKLYFAWESFQLKKYENRLSRDHEFIALSLADKLAYEQEFHATHVEFIPAFTGWQEIKCRTGNGCFCLYHGNLSINENERAVIWLLENVFNDLKIPFVIAGKKPSQRLVRAARKNEQTCLVADPGDQELQDIIAKAQINILPSFNTTGAKLKLLNALFCGRHCIVNSPGVDGSGLENLCTIAEDADDFKTAISYLYKIPFEEEEIEKRRQVLSGLNNNKKNAEKIVGLLWPCQVT